MTVAMVSWNKIWAVIGVLGIPLASLACWLIIFGTKLSVAVEDIRGNQAAQADEIKQIKYNVSELRISIDTIQNRQRDYQMERYYKEKFGKK